MSLFPNFKRTHNYCYWIEVPTSALIEYMVEVVQCMLVCMYKWHLAKCMKVAVLAGCSGGWLGICAGKGLCSWLLCHASVDCLLSKLNSLTLASVAGVCYIMELVLGRLHMTTIA